jgi:hypothetical protein
MKSGKNQATNNAKQCHDTAHNDTRHNVIQQNS